MMNLDPPDHQRLRRLVSRAFVPSRIAALEPSIERIADELLDELEDVGTGHGRRPRRRVRLPVAVPGDLRAPRCARGGSRPAARGVPDAVPTVEWVAAARGRRRIRHDRRVARAPRREPSGAPQDDLVGVLVTASDDDDRLTEQELLSSLFQLIVAGHDTTTSLIGNGVVDLLEHPDQLRLLAERPRAGCRPRSRS